MPKVKLPDTPPIACLEFHSTEEEVVTKWSQNKDLDLETLFTIISQLEDIKTKIYDSIITSVGKANFEAGKEKLAKDLELSAIASRNKFCQREN